MGGSKRGEIRKLCAIEQRPRTHGSLAKVNVPVEEHYITMAICYTSCEEAMATKPVTQFIAYLHRRLAMHICTA